MGLGFAIGVIYSILQFPLKMSESGDCSYDLYL